MQIDLQRLKNTISVPAVFEAAGIPATKHKIPCPFCARRPKDRSSPSMYITVKWCRCYRCEKGGDIFSVTMLLYDCGFRDALLRLSGGGSSEQVPDRRITAWNECEKLNFELQDALDLVELGWRLDGTVRKGENQVGLALRRARIRAGAEREIDRLQMAFWERSWNIMRRAT